MRTLIALTLFAYLAPCCPAEDWAVVHDSGLEATKKKNYSEAVENFEKSWEAAQTRAQRAVTANDLGIVLYHAGRMSDAQNWLRRSIDLWQEGPADPLRLAQTSDALALVDRLVGDYKASETLLRESLKRFELTGNSKSHLLSSLGDILREEGAFAEARSFLRKAENVPGASIGQLLEVQIAIAELDRDTKNWIASVDEWNRASAMAHDHGESGIEAACLRGLGQTWLDQGNLARAEPLLKRAMALFESAPLTNKTQTGTVLAAMGQLYLAQDRIALAEEMLNRALAAEEAGFGPMHPQIVIVLELLAETVSRRNEVGMARDYLERALRIMAARFGEQSSMLASVHANWGLMEQHSGHPDRAVIQYRKALDVLKGSPSDLDSFRLSIMNQYAQVLKATHQKREAAGVLAEAQSFRSRH